MKNDIIKNFNLPKYVDGKSFADASSMIMDKFRERKDPESKRTMTELLDRLRQAQEFVKEQNKTPEEREQEQMQMQEQQMQQEQPQDVNPQMEEQMMPEQPQQQMQQTQFAEGGLMNYMKGNAGGIASAGAGAINMIGDLSGEGVSTNATTAGLTGAAKGAMAGMALGPWGAAAGGVLGGVTGLIGSGKAKREMLEKEQNETQLGRNQALNTFSEGGQMTNKYALGDWLKTAGKNVGTATAKTGKFLNENKGDILRYAPTAINAFQLATLPKAEVESLNKLNNRYKPGYVDEAALQNNTRENYNMTSQALTGASGGSTSALRSNILGAGLNRNKAISDAYLKSSDINRGENAKAQQFNLGVDRVNLQQSNSEKDINARNRAARDNEKSKLLSGIGTDIGSIGKEEKYKDIIGKVSGYDQYGKLAAAKKAAKEKAKKDRILKRKLNQAKKTIKKSPINAIQRNNFDLYNGLKTNNV